MARTAAKTKPVVEPDEPAISPQVAGTTIRLVALSLLERAPENVRHTRESEDVMELADDIAAHGLLQSLIGYEGPHLFSSGSDERIVYIVGGGRRLGALTLLVTRGLIDDGFAVPVLIRDKAEAIELSLAENLARRDMSPVDEFLAFDALMQTGTTSPAELAKRFGFSERYVRQRLRLAALAPPVLDALRERTLTLDGAMAYAATQDRDLQAAVFTARAKNNDHRPDQVKWALRNQQQTEDSTLARFVGAEIYERDGGGYEDDLFAGTTAASDGDSRRLRDAGILTAAAQRMIDLQAVRLIAEIKAEHPTVEGYLVPPGLLLDGYPWKAPAAPKGWVAVERGWVDSVNVTSKMMWAAVEQHGIPAQVIIGVDGGYGKEPELSWKSGHFFVPADKAELVKPRAAPRERAEYVPPTPEERAAERREREIEQRAYRLAVGAFTGTPLDGRAFWPRYNANPVEDSRDPRHVAGKLVAVQIFVTDAAAAGQREEAARLIDEAAAAEAEREAAQKAAREAGTAALERRKAEVVAMEPPPAVVIVNGEAYYRYADGTYQDQPESDDVEADYGFDELVQMLADADTIDGVFETLDAYLATLSDEVSA